LTGPEAETKTTRPRVLLTGSAGRVGKMIRPHLRRHFVLRCLDERPDKAETDEEVVVGDVTNLQVVEQACRDVAAVVHLAAHPNDADFMSELLPRNIVGSWTVFEAARRAAVSRVVLASTVQTVIGSPPAEIRYHVEDVPEPLNMYGCSKLFGEATGRYYAREHGMKVACLRLGACLPGDHPWFESDPSLAELWCDPADLARLIVAAIESDIGFATVFAVSKPASRMFDSTNPYGWQPEASMVSGGDRAADERG
jgi:uronate dehydrogenase